MIGRARLARLLGSSLVPWGLAIACAAAVAAHQQVRDNAQVAAGTASIAGTVFVAGDAKQPARRVRVTLTNLARTSPGQTTTTDDRGAFSFSGVTAGRFELQAFKPGYLRGSYGAARPERAGTPIVVEDGEAIADLTVTIAPGGVITGVVRDARGNPVPGQEVRVLKLAYNAVTGERTLVSPGGGSTTTTDDRGEYRAFGLPPGGYLVLVNPPRPSGPPGAPGADDIRVLTSDEVQRALQEARAGGTRAAPARVTASSKPARVNDAPVFHPGVTDIGAAATIALGVSEERTNVDVTLQLVPTATISGTISSASGPVPQSIRVQAVPAGASAEMLAGAGLRGLTAQPRADGTYTIAGVSPGSYTVKALFVVGGGRGRAIPEVPTVWAAADVTVNGQDLDVPLTLQPGVTVSGRVVFKGAQPTPAELQSLSFKLVPLGSGGAAIWTGGGQVTAEGRFSFVSVTPDAYQFTTTWNSASAGGKWTLESSTANGRDAFEAPLRVMPNEPVDWTITFTDTPTTLTGVLQDRGGRAAADYYILLFSSDRRFWTPGSRRVRMTRPATDGTFSVKGVPPGEYLVAALTDLESGEWNDPTLLEQLVKSSVKVPLRDGETTRQDFRIGGL